MSTDVRSAFIIAVVVTSLCSSSHAQNSPAVQARKAKLKFEGALRKAALDYAAELESVAKDAAKAGDFDEAKRLNDLKEDVGKNGVSSRIDPTRKHRQLLHSSLLEIKDGAILELRPDFTALNRISRQVLPWTMTDPQTVILGAPNPTKPLYIYKFDTQLKSGTVYKYLPSKEKRRTITRVPKK